MRSTKDVLDHHLKAFGDRDVDATLADYAPDAVMFTPGGPVKGAVALRQMFESLYSEWRKPGVTFEMKQQTVDGNFAFIFWNAETADNVYEACSDAFVVNNGKCVAHFFAGRITSKVAGNPKS